MNRVIGRVIEKFQSSPCARAGSNDRRLRGQHRRHPVSILSLRARREQHSTIYDNRDNLPVSILSLRARREQPPPNRSRASSAVNVSILSLRARREQLRCRGRRRRKSGGSFNPLPARAQGATRQLPGLVSLDARVSILSLRARREQRGRLSARRGRLVRRFNPLPARAQGATQAATSCTEAPTL